jgi:hypothetical protein
MIPPRGSPPDRYALYERTVQHPGLQAAFLAALLPHGTSAPVLGEDFSGTGAISRAWVEINPQAAAICVDHDTEPLEYLAGKERITAHHADVLDVDDPADVLAVLNFSICQWRTRASLLGYLRHARARLRTGGSLVLDLYGGESAFSTGCYDLSIDEPDSDGSQDSAVLYRWEQQEVDPATGRVRNAMHFQMADGSWWNDVFVYEWRLWSIPEMRDALCEAGFGAVKIYDRLGDAIDTDGRVYPKPIGHGSELSPDYVVYLVAQLDDGAAP